MPNQILLIEPQDELKFKVDAAGSFEQGITTYMSLTNPTNDTILFKIKTTAPKKYCVRPNSGALGPNKRVEIAITPQAVYVDSAEKHKHKFMVQSVIAPEGKTNVDQVWKDISPTQLMDYKLKCVFESRGNDAGDNAGQNEANAKKRVAVSDEKTIHTKDTVEGFIQNEAKAKDADDNLAGKNSVEVSSFDGNTHNVSKLNAEIVQLRKEDSKLRQENLQLKEEIVRLHQSRDTKASTHCFAPKPNSLTSQWLMIAIGMALLGIIVGKFFV